MADVGELDEVVREFLVESHEGLDRLDRDLVVLEKEPRSAERLASVFRTIHTIKGTCGFLSFGKLESVAHVGESLLSRLRDGRLTLNAEITSALLAMVDAVRCMLATIERTGSDGDDAYAELIARLDVLQQALAGPGDGAEPARGELEQNDEAAVSPAAAELVVESFETAIEVPAAVAAEASDGDRAAAGAAGEGRGPVAADTTIRVDVGLLDKLMNLVGELVLARNQILQVAATHSDTSFIATTQRLNLITTELQEGVMKTRMQPIGNIWSKFPRVVRDVALTCGKQVRVEMEGRETELDKTIIEAIKDPLTHVVRNAVDHGVEAPEKRVAAGKPAEGRLFMRAFHEGGQVNIEISDDGAGIDPERLKQKALQRGLLDSDQLARLSDREILSLIFLPGFSTAEKVTNVSGRGVGMDVVKTNIEKIGGTVDIQSRLGHGTTLKIKIPLTLAIIPALVATSGGERYAIPQVSLLELVRLEGELARRSIENIHGAPVYRLRGNLLPLVYLSRELGNPANLAGEATRDEAINIVVLQADQRRFGLVVDSIDDTEEIVVKPLGKQLKGIATFAGATIMGDGRVALILDVLGLAQRAGVVAAVRERSRIELAAQAAELPDERRALLLLGIGASARVAIPLAMVDRLEEFPSAAIERSAQHEVVQYRGEILPLIRLAQGLGIDGEPERTADELLRVVVCCERGRRVGLVVERILDIVADTLEVQRGVAHDGLRGAAILQQRVTDLLDVHAVIRKTLPGFFDSVAA